eukprot:3948870-Amphidinium_carterae.1
MSKSRQFADGSPRRSLTSGTRCPGTSRSNGQIDACWEISIIGKHHRLKPLWHTVVDPSYNGPSSSLPICHLCGSIQVCGIAKMKKHG